MSIRILLVDDHTLFRSGLRLLLQRQPDFEIVAEAGDGVEGLKRAKELKPDVVLLDLNLPGLSGLETLQLLVQDLPSCAVIILTVSEEADELGQALRDGARGYLVKNIDAEALTSAIRRAAGGEPVIAQSMTAKLVEQFRGQAQAGAQPAGRASAKGDPRETQIVVSGARRQQQGHRARAGREREHGQDPCAECAEEAQPHQPRAGRRVCGGTRAARRGMSARARPPAD